MLVLKKHIKEELSKDCNQKTETDSIIRTENPPATPEYKPAVSLISGKRTTITLPKNPSIRDIFHK